MRDRDELEVHHRCTADVPKRDGELPSCALLLGRLRGGHHARGAARQAGLRAPRPVHEQRHRGRGHNVIKKTKDHP